jgi:aspartate carbamoyltransferase regulatory subunit
MGVARKRHADAAFTRFRTGQERLTCYFCAGIIEEDAVLRSF